MEEKRYIIELTALCARILAEKSRKLSQEERYYFLKSIPKHLHEYVRAFPTDFIEWYKDEALMSKDMAMFYLKNPDKQHYIREGFKKDCEKGITRRRVLIRKCGNYYCQNRILEKIIATPYDIYWRLCNECKRYRIPHHKWMKIRHFIITGNKI